MAIKNYICKSCDHYTVCKLSDTIEKFSSEQKKPMGVDIQLLNCNQYSGDGETFDEQLER